MNKYQEALEEAKLEYAINTDESEKAKQKAFATLQALVDRATPKMVVDTRIETWVDLSGKIHDKFGKCPHCGKELLQRTSPYFCPHKDCGQSLEWEEGEKK